MVTTIEGAGHLRVSIDTGGTFTDLVVEQQSGALSLFKAPTTPENPVDGIVDVLDLAANEASIPLDSLLERISLLIHSTTRATNALVTKEVARTALLTTMGHPDILLFREGGRLHPFDFTQKYPEPFVPRRLTYEIPERIGPDGKVLLELDEDALAGILEQLRKDSVESVGVCLLWSIVNPTHELRVEQALHRHLPDVPYTLSHRLNPSIREYRRAISTSIDASLTPLMSRYLGHLTQRLRHLGFKGRLLNVTSNGGLLDADAVAVSPIHSVGSGPAMAPVAGRHLARLDTEFADVIVADAGGTSFDVSLVRDGVIPHTRQTWIGPAYRSDITGFPSVDVRSVGAGGGSIAWVDDGGLLCVGPRSAGAVPGPVCYGKGGEEPTVTDAAVLLGYINPTQFAGGMVHLDADAARKAIESFIGSRLGLDPFGAALAILRLTTEHMVHAIEDITLSQGIDPCGAVLVAGGGAAGLNAVSIARRLGCPQVLVPSVAPTLSAAGALFSHLSTSHSGVRPTSSDDFDLVGVNALLANLRDRCLDFIEGPGAEAVNSRIRFTVEARYPQQVWELDIPITVDLPLSVGDVETIRSDFHQQHKAIFAISDPASPIEMLTWRATAECEFREPKPRSSQSGVEESDNAVDAKDSLSRIGYFGKGLEPMDIPVHWAPSLKAGAIIEGPAFLDSPLTTVVLEPESAAKVTDNDGILVNPDTSSTPLASRDVGR